MVTPYEEYVAVAEELAALTPGDHEKRSALFNSGAEAVENAIKVARSATGRQAVVAFDHAYHGRTNLTMGLTAKNMPYKHRFGPFASEIHRVPMAYPYRWPTGADRCLEEAFEEFVALVHAQIGEDNTAAVIIEPIQGEGGFIVPPDGFLTKVAQYCRDNGIVFIADEVQSGFVPDLITTAKGIAGGLPLAAVTGRAELMDAVHVGGLGGTYGGNPVACVAALAAIETMREDDLNAAARAIEDTLTPRLKELADRTGRIGEIRGRGAMIAVEIVKPGTDEPDAAFTAAVAKACHAQGVVLAIELVSDQGAKTPDPALTAAVNKACHARGLVTLTCGTFGNVFRFLPPLTIAPELLTEGMDILDEAFDAALG